jgi:hypothetical protein
MIKGILILGSSYADTKLLEIELQFIIMVRQLNINKNMSIIYKAIS